MGRQKQVLGGNAQIKHKPLPKGEYTKIQNNCIKTPLIVSWANVIYPLMTSQSIVCDVVASSQGTSWSMKAMMDDHRMRYEMVSPPGAPIMIFSQEHWQLLSLLPDQKQAVLIDLSKYPDQRPEDLVESIRNVINEQKNDPNTTIEQLEDTVVDGRDVIVFKASSEQDTLTIWADPETLLPVRLELIQNDVHTVITNFQFDVELDPSLFSMDIPAGYSTASVQMEFEGAEEDLIEGLQIWAQFLEDNKFPKDLSGTTYMNAMPGLRKKFQNGTLQLSEQQKIEMGLKIHKSNLFIASLKSEQDWHYVGAYVPFGDADKPVGWYKPVGSETYRVIYGDLSVRNMPSEELPK
jgi:outer membrane lipoprotein-sorting protein